MLAVTVLQVMNSSEKSMCHYLVGTVQDCFGALETGEIIIKRRQNTQSQTIWFEHVAHVE
jgi:hypothetical protein